MTVQELRRRADERLDIHQFNAMQEAMAAQALPVRLQLSAPTGAGKTLAAAVPFLASLPKPCGKPVGLAVVPTRELAVQTYEVLRTLAAPEFKTVAFYGGHSMQSELASLSGNPDIIVATPGRLVDHLHRGGLSLHQVRSVILDEYDKALELGFHKEMKAIMGRLGNASTLILTSATGMAELPDFIDGIGMTRLDFFTEGAPAPNLEVLKIESDSPDKLDTLAQTLRHTDGRSLVFVNHREAVERVAKAMAAKGIPAGLYHGALEQDDREQALILFGNGTTPILIATDLAARGLDVPEVENVIHYHLPLTPEVWTHRNGRSGRQGAEGQVAVIVSEKDRIPEFITFDRTISPAQIGNGTRLPAVTTLYINAGRKDKISRGDVAGFILRNSPLPADRLGRIDLRDHAAFAAVPAERAREVIEALKPFKLKNHRVRVSQIKG